MIRLRSVRCRSWNGWSSGSPVATNRSDVRIREARLAPIHPRDELTLPLEATHEHALLVLSGLCTLNGQHLEEKVLYYLGTQRSEIGLRSDVGARLLLIGGVPFPETILMWWNFVARTPEEIREARNDWEAHRTFGDVPAYKAARIPAPALVRLAPPNPVS